MNHSSKLTFERKNQMLVTITPYTEKGVPNGCPSGGPPPPAPPLPLLSKTRHNEDSVEMQSIESFKLKETPNPVVPKPPSTYFPVPTVSSTSNGNSRNAVVETKCYTKEQNSTSPAVATTKPIVSPTSSTVASLKPVPSKVAIRIGAYEGEAKQPARLEFLPQQTRSEKNSADEIDQAPVASRLQNELAATLQRSNLRRKTEEENHSPAKTIPGENAATFNNDSKSAELMKQAQSNVETLASALDNKVTIKVSPDK